MRIDTGVRQGDEITPFYDPMIAKLIVHGDTRAEAIASMRAALAQYQIVGVRTNVEFLGRLMSAPAFVEAALDTALIERERDHLFAPRARSHARDVGAGGAGVVAGAARGVQNFIRLGRQSPWDDRGGWALGERGERRLRFREGEVEREIALRSGAGESPGVVCGNEIHLFLDGEHRQFHWIDPYLPAIESADAHGGLRATMPGRVLAVLVKAGDEVAKGAPLVVLEAMKMEQTVTAPLAGKVDRVLCEVGEQVREGAELLAFAEQ